MSEDYRPFASYLRFKEILADPMGHLYRAAEFDAGGIIRTVWLRIFDGPHVPADELAGALDEARAIADKVQSTSIAGGFDSAVVDGVPAIAYDYVSSTPLSIVLERGAEERFPVPVDNALLILEKISLALTATLTLELDGSRVVHGFLHPGLILVTNDGEAQVTGFGVAPRLLSLVDRAPPETVHPYLAPEVILNRSASPRGDVYSLGALLFHVLTGSALPVEVAARAAALDSASYGDEKDPLPDDIRSLLQRSLAEAPDDRFSSAVDFKKELDRLLYGGAYSPTTFNLALFMDRLFRAEIEAEEGERAREQRADVRAYLEPVKEADPVVEEVSEKPKAGVDPRWLWIGGGAAAAVAIGVAAVMLIGGREPRESAAPPTPTAAEIEAQRQAQDDKMRQLAESLVAEMMAEKETEIRQELSDRQARIDELQRRLAASERRAREGELSREEQQRQQELQRQIAAAEEAQRQQEADLEAERQRVAEEALAQVEPQQEAVESGGEGAGAAAAAAAAAAGGETASSSDAPGTQVVPGSAPTATAAPVQSSPQPTAEPTPVPTEAPTPSLTPTPSVREGDLVSPGPGVTPPKIISRDPPAYPSRAQSMRLEGVVEAQALIGIDGSVEEVRIVSVTQKGVGFEEATRNAVLRWRYQPATKMGVKVRTWLTIRMPFRLQQ
jgi:TonB family protein